MKPRPFPLRAVFFLGLMLAVELPAQTPDSILFFKTLGALQTSASAQEASEAGIGLMVTFPGTVPGTTQIQLSGNGNVLSVPLISPGIYFLIRTFANEADMDRSLPDGAYTLTITGGGAGSSTPIVMPPAGSLRPVLFSNFDQLQAWPARTVRFAWAPIQGAGNVDSLMLTVSRPNGTVLFESPAFGQPGALASSATFLDVPGLPMDEPLVGMLTYVRLSLGFGNSGATITATGRGFTVRVPLRILSSKATIVRQPRSQTVAAGSTVVFSAEVTGNSLSYQWRYNGVPISGATGSTLVVTNASAARAGFYTLDATSTGGSVTSAAASLVVDSTVLPGRITNLAIRARSGSAAQTLIVGFAIGPAGQSGTKPILLRGIGPGLSDFGVPGVLSDPRLQLYLNTQLISENDDWAGNAQVTTVARAVGAFALTSPTSKDAALYNPAFTTATYSVQLTGAPNTTGVALAEIYDATPSASFTATTPRLINVSARSQVGSGADILIAGFIISGASPKTVLIRAIGPTLGNFGVQGALADPSLELFSGPTQLEQNDNWGGGTTLANIALNAGAFTLSPTSRDAALLVTLPPGAYTAQVSGVNSTAGVALVEIYEVP